MDSFPQKKRQFLEDHPRTPKWLTTMVSTFPKYRVVGPLPNGLNGLQMGVTKHLLTGMILEVDMQNT